MNRRPYALASNNAFALSPNACRATGAGAGKIAGRPQHATQRLRELAIRDKVWRYYVQRLLLQDLHCDLLTPLVLIGVNRPSERG